MIKTTNAVLVNNQNNYDPNILYCTGIKEKYYLKQLYISAFINFYNPRNVFNDPLLKQNEFET